MIDPAAVELLNRLVASTGAKVVISSSWRVCRTLEQIQDDLRSRGFVGEVIGATPSIIGHRGHEIAAWLTEHGPASFVILDDDSDMAHLKPRLVRTTFARGLQLEHIETARALLGAEI